MPATQKRPHGATCVFLSTWLMLTFGAGADWGVVLDVAVGAAAAHLGGPEAGVLAVQVDAGLLVVAVVVLGALRVAPGAQFKGKIEVSVEFFDLHSDKQDGKLI